MISEYGGRNCWSFKEWVQINFKINKNVPSEYGFSDINIVPLLCFEGPNASGKSCALRILTFICDFCSNSFAYNPDGGILYNSFFNNADKSEFYVTFSLPENIHKEYTYELVLDTKKVYSEVVFTKENGRKTTIIKRLNNKITTNNLFSNSNIVLRDNASLISTLKQYGIKEIIPFFSVFANVISNVTFVSTNSEPKDIVSEFYYHNSDILDKFVVPAIRRFDTGIKDIKIQKVTDANNKDVYISWFIHEAGDEDCTLPYYAQSTGTQLLFTRLKDLFMALANGGIVIFDELDCHLHFMIVKELVELFMDKNVNINHAQLLFTSQIASLLDIAKKYRAYLFNKENGESYCYRIDEIKEKDLLRNDRPLEPIYNSGLIGGVPNVKKV